MKNYVIDASVAVKWYIPEPLSDAAVSYLELYRREQAGLIAPDLLITEVGSVLWKKVGRNELTAGDAREIAGILVNHCPLRLFPAGELMPAALELAMTSGLTVYDSIYLALAISSEAPLVTADREIKNLLGSPPFAGQVILLGDHQDNGVRPFK